MCLFRSRRCTYYPVASTLPIIHKPKVMFENILNLKIKVMKIIKIFVSVDGPLSCLVERILSTLLVIAKNSDLKDKSESLNHKSKLIEQRDVKIKELDKFNSYLIFCRNKYEVLIDHLRNELEDHVKYKELYESNLSDLESIIGYLREMSEMG
ncbi:hypothetical protein BpHYR1_004056 [Brachionus plicatilis]|uniref:Uncharacterized protein n=1 Tax=Brachionus plicatilis TaxID=10195 RepID=A0A3M7QYH0_BRAPC|nr:hypothetical protein BpHYR1_004056 [Brachionus plicatilis]